MGYRLREIDAESKFSHTLSFDAFAQVLPLERLTAVLAAEHLQTPCERKLNLPITMIVTSALHLYPHLAIDDILRKLAQGLRLIWPDPYTGPQELHSEVGADQGGYTYE
jgi:hypothetical protein